MKSQGDKILRGHLKSDFHKTIKNDRFTEDIMSKIVAQKSISSQPLISMFWILAFILTVLLLIIFYGFIIPENDASVLSNIKGNFHLISNFIFSNSVVFIGVLIGLFFISVDFFYRKRNLSN